MTVPVAGRYHSGRFRICPASLVSTSEVKRVEKLNVVEAMEQSIRDSEQMRDGMPALFHRRNRKPWLVTMRLVDWLKLYRSRDEVENEQRTNRGK